MSRAGGKQSSGLDGNEKQSLAAAPQAHPAAEPRRLIGCSSAILSTMVAIVSLRLMKQKPG